MMKSWSALFFFLFMAIAVHAQTASPIAPITDVLLVKETSFDFGKIPQGRPVSHTFSIVNTGSKPLLLENVQASCGCTTPEWSKEPIKPGATATIKVGYNAAGEGVFNKPITIHYNVNQIKTLMITGNVYKAPASSAPVNASLALLKYTDN